MNSKVTGWGDEDVVQKKTIVIFAQARKTFKIAWEPEFPRKIAFEHFEVKPTPITLINLVLCRKGPL